MFAYSVYFRCVTAYICTLAEVQGLCNNTEVAVRAGSTAL